MVNIYTSQLKKLTRFITILIVLFIGAVIFNITYKWDGIPIILRIYIFIFSFYIVYIFASLDTDSLKREFTAAYGERGLLKLFFTIRVAPFLTIYATLIVLTFINYMGSPDWFWESILNILNGRYSNTLIYSLILLLILKVKKTPRVTIPLFLFLCVAYFLLYRTVYNFSPSGFPASFLKILNFIIVIFILFLEFFRDSMRVAMIALHTVILSVLLYFASVGCFYLVNKHSALGSYGQIKSATTLLKMGYSYPLKQVKETIQKHSNFHLITHLIYYSRKYGKNIDFTIEEWEQMMFSDTVQRADYISRYLLEKIGSVSFRSLIAFAEIKSNNSGKELVNAQYFIEYSAKYYEEFREDLQSRFFKGNIYFKLWVLRVIGEAGVPRSIPFLVDRLTDLNMKVSEEAYGALMMITKIDLAKIYNVRINNPRVIREYMNYYQSINKEE